MAENELMHYGIKGQMWGRRLYQNKDGSLTALGRKRYNKQLERVKAEQKIVRNKQRTQAKLKKLEEMEEQLEKDKAELEGAAKTKTSDAGKIDMDKIDSVVKDINKLKTKDINEMTNEELEILRNRLVLENNLKAVMPKKEESTPNQTEAKPTEVKQPEPKQLSTNDYKKLREKSLSDMSNEELEIIRDRLNLESKVKEVMPKNTEKGKSLADVVIKEMGGAAAKDIGTQLMKSGFAALANDVFKLEGDLKVYPNNQKKK